MILIINTCSEEMHYLEFVQPIIDIVKSAGAQFAVAHYTQLTSIAAARADKIIICGTSLHDFGYQAYLERFVFLQSYDKPVLGICAGMQIIAQTFGCTLTDGREIGMKTALFEKEFLGIAAGESREIYCLHKKIIADDLTLKKQFIVCAKTEPGYVQAIRHKEKSFFGILFHPEVRNKDVITHFVSL